MELSGHCECGWRHDPALLRPEFSELYQTQGHHQPPSKQDLLAASSCNLTVSRPPLVTMQLFQIPINPYLTSTLLASSNHNSRQTT